MSSLNSHSIADTFGKLAFKLLFKVTFLQMSEERRWITGDFHHWAKMTKCTTLGILFKHKRFICCQDFTWASCFVTMENHLEYLAYLCSQLKVQRDVSVGILNRACQHTCSGFLLRNRFWEITFWKKLRNTFCDVSVRILNRAMPAHMQRIPFPPIDDKPENKAACEWQQRF